MKFLDKINIPATWNIGAVVTVLGIAGAVLTNPQAISVVVTLVTTGPIAAKIAAVGVLLGIVAVAIGKPPATSPSPTTGK